MVVYNRDKKELVIPVGWGNELGILNRDYEEEYLTFQILTPGAVEINRNGSQVSFNNYTVDYRINRGEWTTVSCTAETKISLETGDIIEWRGTNPTYSINGSDNHISFRSYSGATMNVYGNIMSLLYGDDFLWKRTIENRDCFSHLFGSGIGGWEGHKALDIIECHNLILPATVLSNGAYSYMFLECTNMVSAPRMAKVDRMGGSTYAYMFKGCENLTRVQEKLLSTELGEYCYSNMFEGCKNLIVAPVLPAETLVTGCYAVMFKNCKALKEMRCYAVDRSALFSTADWLTGIPGPYAGVFYGKNVQAWPEGGSGIPAHWMRIEI